MAAGAGEILQLIRSGRATTRTQVLEATGLSRVTVAQRMDALVAAGIIRAAGDAGATGGRRAERFVFDPTDSLVLVAALELGDVAPDGPAARVPGARSSVGASHAATGRQVRSADTAALAVVDPHGALLARATLAVDLGAGPGTVVPRLLDAFEVLLADAGIKPGAVGGVALSVPGPVDPHDSRLSDPPVMPGWGAWPVVEAVRERFAVPVHLENDADAMAYGELGALRHERSGDGRPQPFVLVKISGFLGAGLVIDGHIYRGTDGGAGDIGHVDVGGDAVCRCGRRGCLAAEAGGAALLRRLGEAGADVGSLAELRTLAERGDPLVTAELDRAAGLIGRVLAVVVGVLNPADLVVAGELAVPTVIAGIRAGVYAGAQPRATARLRIRPAALGPDAVLVGLARVAVDERFSAEAVDTRLG